MGCKTNYENFCIPKYQVHIVISFFNEQCPEQMLRGKKLQI